MEERIAQRAGHLIVNLGDHIAGTASGGQRAIDTNTKTYLSMLIWWGDMNKGHIERQCSRREQGLDLTQEYRCVVGPSFHHGAADVFAEEQPIVAEMSFVLGAGVIGIAERQHVGDFDIPQFPISFQQCLDEDLRSGTALVNPNAIAGADDIDGAFRGSDLTGIVRLHGLVNWALCRRGSSAYLIDSYWAYYLWGWVRLPNTHITVVH